MIETYRGIVYPSQMDHMGHMNVQWYTSKFDEGTWHFLSTIGITAEYIRKNNKGMVAVEQTTKYKAEAKSGDLLVIKSKILKVTDKSVSFFHAMYNSETGVEIATSELVGLHLDKKDRKACSLPEDIKNKCLVLLREIT